ncbi:MAG TPA: sulfatase-like hydrolase/transferase, partial [Chloroflexota bacterium]|nr:sulfatase-like hydrolase/transferase [Chloroflexota bacterium]
MSSQETSAPNRPNVVVIMTDQQRWNTLGCYGHPVVRTPHLDALARRGVRFEHAYVPIPLCTPSRACLHLSQYPASHGIRANETFPVPDPSRTMPALFRQAGYRSFLAGKDHLFGPEGRAVAFDRCVAFSHGGREPSPDETPTDAAVREGRKGLMARKYVEVEPFPADACPTARITDYAIEMAEQAGDQPFFLWLSYPDPHPPFVVCEPYATLYRGAEIDPPITKPNESAEKPLRQQVSQRLMRMDSYSVADLRRMREIYYGMITFVDDQIGRLLRHLDALGKRENTIFVF